MPRHCSVCARPDREIVDAALVNGGSFREIGGHFGLALGTIHRHARHARRPAVATLEEASEKCGENSLAQVDALASEAERALADPDPPAPAMDAPDPSDQSFLAHVHRRMLERWNAASPDEQRQLKLKRPKWNAT